MLSHLHMTTKLVWDLGDHINHRIPSSFSPIIHIINQPSSTNQDSQLIPINIYPSTLRLMEQLVYDCEESSSSSSGCESGWTLYLQQDDYSIPHHLKPSHHPQHQEQEDQQEEEDIDDGDDMSMVSDASSGPPHDFQEQDEDAYGKNNDDDDGVLCYSPLMNPRKRRKILKQTSFHSHRDHFPDHDTASSPFFTTKDLKVCNKEDDNSSDYSQGHSTTHFEMV